MILETTFIDGAIVTRLVDFLTIGSAHPVLVRQITALAGRMTFRCELALRFDYGLVRPLVSRHDATIIMDAGSDRVTIRCPVPLRASSHDVLTSEFDLAAGQCVTFTHSYNESYGPLPPTIDIEQAQRTTRAFWEEWASRFRCKTPWQSAVVRSLLILKALVYQPTGAMIAAPTTSLPETPGGVMNWDYRFCWLRDATFTISALVNAGYHDEAIRWRDWMLRTITVEPDKMRILYRIDGSRQMYEHVLPWLRGYEDASPVRIGNDAAAQRQVDVVGELLTCLDLMEQAGIEPSQQAIAAQHSLVLHLERTWSDKGQGLWESRGKPQHYTYPRVMAWAGIQSFLRMAVRRGETDASQLDRLRALAARIHKEVSERSWNIARGHFVDRYGGSQLDASLLQMALVGFLEPNDPRTSATIDAIERELSEDGLVWRRPHGGDLEQGAFVACSCWLADCRAQQGRREDAVALFERVLSLRNDVGLPLRNLPFWPGTADGQFPSSP